MANTTISAKEMTTASQVRREIDVNKPAPARANAAETAPGNVDPGAEIERARQRLSAEARVTSDTTLDSPQAAMQRARQLKELISDDAHGALRAHGATNQIHFEAAMARPPA